MVSPKGDVILKVFLVNTTLLQALGAGPIVSSQKGSGNDMPVKTKNIIYLLFPLSPKINTIIIIIIIIIINFCSKRTHSLTA
jgi:hypothetical protein